jgi:hypothetical protein
MRGDAEDVAGSDLRRETSRPIHQVAVAHHGHVLAAMDTVRRSGKADDRDHVQRPWKVEKGADCLSGLPDAVEGILAPVAVLPKHAVVDGDMARPVLGVHHEDARRADCDVVDVCPPSAGPPHVV